jgi:hypothetical protein
MLSAMFANGFYHRVQLDQVVIASFPEVQIQGGASVGKRAAPFVCCRCGAITPGLWIVSVLHPHENRQISVNGGTV